MLFILNRDYQVMGVADNTSEGALHYFNDKLTTDLTAGVSTFEFDVYKTNPTSAFLQEGNYITLKDTHGKQLLFTIMEMEEDSTKKSIYCEDVGLDLLNETVPPLKSATAQPISWYIQQSTNDSGWKIGTNQVSHLKRTLEYEGYSNALQRILSICNSFDGVEVDFTVEFKGNAVTKQLINIYRKRGKDSGLRYNAGIDLAEARRTVSLNDLATALRGVGSEITNKNNEVIGNTTFTNIVYDDGRYFTTKGSPFVFDREANKRWSRYRNMQSATQGYIVDYFEYDTKSEQELFNRALSQLKKRSEPAVEYEIEISKIKDNLMVGDTIEIVDNYFQPALHLQARVLAVTTSETVDSDNKLKLGNYKIIQSSIDEKLLALQAKLNSIKLSWSENNAPVLVVKSTNGEAFFNNYIDTNLNASIIRGGIDITNSYTSDEVVWSKRDRFGVNVSGWNRTGFSIPLSIEDINTKNTFVATVDGMEAQITIFNTLTTVESPTAPTEPQQGQIWLDTSVQPPIQKVYLGGKWKHVTPITEEQFEDVKAISELASSGVESLNGELATVKDNVAGKVDSTTYTQKVSAIESALANKVEQAVQSADKLALEAEIAKKVAQTAYDTKVAELDTAISGYETRITETETGLLATAKQTDVNAIEGRLSTAETGIETNASQIALKASTSDLNATNGRLSTAEGSITINAQNIASKVSQTDFNALSGRVGTAESTITQQAGLIESKVAQTTYDTDINNATTGLKKKMSNAESRITQTEKDITSKVSQTTYDADINNATTGLKKRISTAESTITQQAGLIASKVESTTYTTEMASKANASDVYKKAEVDTKVNAKADNATVNPLITRVSNAESKITQTEKDIALRATKTEAQGYAQTAVDGIQIGGRNLIIKKNALNDIESSSIGLSKWGYLLSNSSKSISLSLNSNEKYALSFLGHNEGNPQNVKIDLSGVENIQKTLSIGTGSNKYTWNFETPNLEGVGKKVYPFQTLDDWIRYYKNSPNLITDVNNTTYGKWGFSGVQLPNMAPVKGGMFGGAFPINGNLHGSVDSPATAWAGINLSKAYMETNDATLLPKIIAIGDYFVRNAIDIETWGVSFKAFPNNIEFNEVSNTWVANTRFIHTRTFYHVAWALLEIYDVTKDVRYSTLAGQLLDGATAYQLVATAQSNSGELPPYFAGSMYNTINRVDDGYIPDWVTFTNTNGDVVMKATKKWIKLFGNTTRTSFDLYAWADVNYTVKSIADNYMNHLLYLYRNQGLRKSDGHKLLYCFSHYEWSDTPHSSGYMVPIPMNWDFINEEFGKEQWFTGDLMFWAIIGFAEAGETVIATALLDRYYELKSPDSEGRLLFYDRYTANGTPLVEDTSKSITFTALYMQARNILDNHNYDSEALLALKHYQKTSPYLTVDGGYSWDTEHSDALIENKSLGEVIYSIFENVSRVKPPLFLTFENTILNPVYILDIKLETGNKHTDYTPAPEDVEEQIVAIETRVNDAELLITPEAITATVVESEDLTTKLQGYATQESLGNYISSDDFSTEKENIMGEIDSRIGAIDYSPFVQATELEQKANAITAKISQAGGVNLIQNSIGWAGKDFWSNFSATAGVSIQNEELASMGFGSGWYSSASGAFNQKQRLTLPRAGTYTLSFWLKKTAGSSWAFVQVQKGDDTTFANANAFAYAGYQGAKNHDAYELYSTTFEATELDVAISITIATGVEATITGIMLHEGSEPFKWQPYTSEVYNTNVKMDMNGITVKNNQDAGYTLITPDEFSGYAPVDGTVERVFTLNGDTTEVKKLKAEQQFQMAPVTIITIDNSKYSGWAFI